MIMMATLIAIFGYRACMQGEFECTVQHFPDISHVMGVAPLNKLYAMMFMVYSFSKQAEARAHYQHLQSFVSPLVNNLLLVAAAFGFVFGPCIGFWDCYMNMDIHVKITTLFTSGEVAYLFIIVPVMALNRSHYAPEASPIIDSCCLGIFTVLCVGAVMHLGGLPGVSTNQIGEWIAFYSDFFVRFQMARLIQYKNEVRPVTP